ncbi:MAG: alpha/beta hydrolase [Lachnospiraceae bacterium]|nr:alpha/beta hydrolase [Lachnospiraceae bacterium]
MLTKGTYNFHEDANFNFQLNRVVMWGNGVAEDIAKVAGAIKDSESWVQTLTRLADEAEQAGNTDAEIGYRRMSEFFMYDADPRKLKTYQRSKALFYQHKKDQIIAREIHLQKIPYGSGHLPVMLCKGKGECRGRILLHGGNDSYLEEFFDAMLYLQEHGFDVYVFEGPGQGGCLREQNMKFTPEWEKPVKAVLDALALEDVTIVGASLGGYLAPRAAAFDKRITKVIAWSVFPDFFDILLADDPKVVRMIMDTAFRRGFSGILNGFYRKMMGKSELIKWNLMHGMYAYDASDPVGYVKKIREFTLKGIGENITQDILVLGAKNDHMIMPQLFHEEFDLLPNVRSLSFQMYSDTDDAGSHCGIGNMKLILDTMISWMQLMDRKEEKFHESMY